MRLNFFEHRTFVLVTKSSIFVRSDSFFVGKLHLSHSWGYSKKIWQASHFGHVFTNFQKSIRARWGLTFSNNELCFGQQIVNLVWFGSFFVGKLHLSLSWGEIKKIGQS